MEKLLNKLIEKGWKPFGKKYKNVCREPNKRHSYMFDYDVYYRRELVSKESGLWQFVCENGFVPKDERVSWRKINEDGDYINHYSKYREKGSDVGYRLIESALKDESELEEFLLQNIKIEGND